MLYWLAPVKLNLYDQESGLGCKEGWRGSRVNCGHLTSIRASLYFNTIQHVLKTKPHNFIWFLLSSTSSSSLTSASNSPSPSTSSHASSHLHLIFFSLSISISTSGFIFISDLHLISNFISFLGHLQPDGLIHRYLFQSLYIPHLARLAATALANATTTTTISSATSLLTTPQCKSLTRS